MFYYYSNEDHMLNIIKKTCITALFFGCILFPMDPPTEEIVPISIITLLDANIQYFSKSVTDLDDKITRAGSRENLKKKLETDKLEPQKLLELNQSFKKQWQDDLEKQLQKQQQLRDNLLEEQKRMDEEFGKYQEHLNTEIAKTFTPDANLNLDEHQQKIDRRIDKIVTTQSGKLVDELNEISHQYDESIKRTASTNPIQNKQKFENHSNNRARGTFVILIFLGFCVYKYWYAR